MTTIISCPFCTAPTKNTSYGSLIVDCSNCGKFGFSDGVSYDDYFVGNNRVDEKRLLLLRYHLFKTLQLRKRSSTNSRFKISVDWIEASLKSGFPSIAEQLDNLVCMIGEKEGFFKDIEFNAYGWKIGSRNNVVFAAVKEGAETKHLIHKHPNITLSFDGHLRYDDIQKGHVGHGAFMAMKFGNPELDGVLDTCFRPAAKNVGFNLKKLDDEPKAGLIDNRMREAIKTSRFIIADLTHENLGAYWEAGYAEGLGKVVIYTCKEQNKDKIHFDTSHHTTIFWDVANLKHARKNLESTIRLSIPEALQEAR